MVRKEPLLEVGYQFQMRIYHAMGNKAMLRKVYQQALNVFQKEYSVGSEPDELKRLYDQLIARK
jgi:two-component SAPR family response regulator